MTDTPSLSGIITAILTPIRDDLTIDHDRLIQHARNLLGDGCSRVSTFGSTGEGVSFSTAQKQAAHRALLAAGIKPEQLLPAVMSSSVGQAADEMRDAASLGCPQVLVLPPYYYRSAGLDGLVSFFEGAYEQAGRPDVGLVLYNIPQMSGITITHELVRALQAGKGARIAGIKDSTGNLESGLAFVKAFPTLSIFTGDDRVLPHLLRAGGAGMIGGLPNLYARDLAALYRLRDGEEAERLAALAAERIVEIDSTGGLMALKAGLAKQHNDPQWRRALPPLDGGFRAGANS
ncbi:MAG: dihydrodipicolinate synthase family protein [Hyphomicrobiales bacterium]|nr:MAG: dihydrodipicolinate synthase family protein [Hyphomicrobiales bacterium]